MLYPYSLSPSTYDGDINGIRVQWSNASFQVLAQQASTLGVSQDILKALSEHYGYLSAYRLQSNQVLIR